MAKIDALFVAFEAGFQNPQVNMGTTWIPDEQMETLKIRRKKAGEAQHRVWYLSIGETGQAPLVTFWGHKPSDLVKQALSWRQMPTKTRRGPKAAQGATA